MNIIEMLNNICKNRCIKNIIHKVGTNKYKEYSFSEKLSIYKEFNTVVGNILDTKLKIYVNKNSKRSVKRDVKLSCYDNLIIVDGLNKNPYVYLKDILMHHLFFLNSEETGFIQVGNVSYNENYLPSESNVVFYNRDNIWMVKKTVEVMNNLLVNIENDYKHEYLKDFDCIITKEAQEELAIANDILDKELKFGCYDALNDIFDGIERQLITNKGITIDNIALLSLDQILLGATYSARSNNVIANNLVYQLKKFIEMFFSEYKADIKITFKDNNLYINEYKYDETDIFLDLILKCIEKIDSNKLIVNELISDEELIKFNKDKKNYSKMDLYFLKRLSKLDKYLEKRNLEWINYVKWTKIYKADVKASIFKDESDIFRNLLDDKDFLQIIKSYLNNKNRNDREYLVKMISMLNYAYTYGHFKLEFDESKTGDFVLGEADKGKITINIENNIDKIATLATIFHEYRHLVQQSEVNENHGIFNKKLYPLIKYNYKKSPFKETYSYFCNDEFAYQNSFLYEMQPIEYDAETFSYWFLKQILNNIGLKINYNDYYPYINDNITFFDNEKISLLSYSNFVKMNDIDKLYDIDENDYSNLIKLIETMKDKKDAIKIFKHRRFFDLDLSLKLKVFEYIGEDIPIKNVVSSKMLVIGNSVLYTTVCNDYQVIEKILNEEALKKIKEGKIPLKYKDEYVFNESRKYKMDDIDIYNFTSTYWYHSTFDKYCNRKKNKENKKKLKIKSSTK